MVMHYILSVPYDEKKVQKQQAFQKIQNKIEKEKGLCECYPFDIPKLRVGTLDALMTLSDDLAKQDSNVEVISMKFLRQWEDVTIEKKDWYPTVDITDSRTGQVTSVPVQSYLKEFKWDESQYSMTKSLRELAEMAYQKASKFDEELKAKISEYTNLKTQLSAVQRKDKGSLTSRTLAGLVEPKHVVESEYLTTLFVVVPKTSVPDWMRMYSTLGDIQYIVPGSSEVIYQDNENALVNVVLFKKIAEDFKNHCRNNRWVVRDYKYDPEAAQDEEKQRKDMEDKRDKIMKTLVRFCKTGFSECFTAWMHLKAIRTYVESILRYGLPPNFVTCMLKMKSTETKLHATLGEMFADLSDEATKKSKASAELDATLAQAASYGMEFFPYVFIAVNTEHELLKIQKAR